MAYMVDRMATRSIPVLATLPSSPGGLIHDRRIELGLTQTELGQLSGISQGDISKIENDHLDARWSTIKRLSDALESVAAAAKDPAHSGPQSAKPAFVADSQRPAQYRSRSSSSAAPGTAPRKGRRPR